MTLTSFKAYLRALVLGIFLLLYGLGFYFLGKSSTVENLIKNNQVFKDNANFLEKPIQSPIPYADNQSGNVIASFVKLCSNTVYGFELAYPKDWFTTYDTDNQKCLFFAPYSFVVPKDSSDFLVPIRIEVVNSVDWQEILKFYQTPNDFQNIVSSQNLEINGQPAQKIKSTTTQEGILSRGFLKISYLIFDSESPLIITYQQLDASEDVKQFENILSEMVDSLRGF